MGYTTNARQAFGSMTLEFKCLVFHTIGFYQYAKYPRRKRKRSNGITLLTIVDIAYGHLKKPHEGSAELNLDN